VEAVVDDAPHGFYLDANVAMHLAQARQARHAKMVFVPLNGHPGHREARGPVARIKTVFAQQREVGRQRLVSILQQAAWAPEGA